MLEKVQDFCRQFKLLAEEDFNRPLSEAAWEGRLLHLLGELVTRTRTCERLEAEIKELEESLTQARQELADRKVIERAKGVVMRELRMAEDVAYHRMQHLASSRNQKLIEVARAILLCSDLSEDDGEEIAGVLSGLAQGA